MGQGHGFADVFCVGQRGKSSGLSRRGGVERLAGFLEDGGDVGAGEAIADAESGKALHFGKSAEDHHGTAFLDPADGGRGLGDELVVSLVEHEERAGGKLFDKGGQLRIGDTGAGGVVGGGEKDEAHLGGKAGDEAGKVVVKVAVRNFLKRDAEKFGHEAVDREGVG